MGAEGARTHCVPYLSGKRTEHNLNTKVYLHRLDDANSPVHLYLSIPYLQSSTKIGFFYKKGGISYYGNVKHNRQLCLGTTTIDSTGWNRNSTKCPSRFLASF